MGINSPNTQFGMLITFTATTGMGVHDAAQTGN